MLSAIPRRSFLAAATAAVLLPKLAHAAEAKPFGEFTVGIQTYTSSNTTHTPLTLGIDNLTTATP